jgi:hypothetical protein
MKGGWQRLGGRGHQHVKIRMEKAAVTVGQPAERQIPLRH